MKDQDPTMQQDAEMLQEALVKIAALQSCVKRLADGWRLFVKGEVWYWRKTISWTMDPCEPMSEAEQAVMQEVMGR